MIFFRQERGLQALALFEAAKGSIVLVVGLGLISLINRDAAEIAEQLTRHLHLDPSSRYPQIFIQAAGRLDDGRLWLFACLAFLYSLFRFVEAYGLWRMRRWAEWVALISGGMYLPFEIYELADRLTWPRILALLVNIVIVVYLAQLIVSQKRQDANCHAPAGG